MKTNKKQKQQEKEEYFLPVQSIYGEFLVYILSQLPVADGAFRSE